MSKTKATINRDDGNYECHHVYDDVIQPDCQPGEMSYGRLCTKCPRGTYQPDSRMTACIACPLNFTTRDVGSANIADCKYDNAAAAVVTADLQSDVPSTTTIIGACFGGFALLLVSVAGFVLCYRRRRHRGSETAPITTTQQEVGEYNETCEVHDTGV
ncbi:hypothetical protein LSAT2_013737 [Lamellibrachia satsuma]|nr:hypothetical protein LSAT2_013737 [Lamellibrachia satsuma]